jgi:hypothetical protein
LKKLYPFEPTGNLARHLNTLAYLIGGIVGSKHVNLRLVAAEVPDGTKNESRIEKFSRWMANERIEADIYFLLFAKTLLANLGHQVLVLAIDGSDVGHECVTLPISVIYEKRALPLTWAVVNGTKGHFPGETHVQLAEQVRELVPEGRDVVFLGDGEFDGIILQVMVDGYDWKYVSRTARNAQLYEEGECFAFKDLWPQPGGCFRISDVLFIHQAYGPVLAVV